MSIINVSAKGLLRKKNIILGILFLLFLYVPSAKANILINTGSLTNETPTTANRFAFNANNKAYIYIDSTNLERLGTTTVDITTNGIVSNAYWTLSECYTDLVLATSTVNYPNYSLASSSQIFYFDIDVSDYDCLHLWVTTSDTDVAGIIVIPSTQTYGTSTFPLWKQENFKYVLGSYTDSGLTSLKVPYIKIEGEWKNPIDCSEETGQCINQENVACTDIFGCIEDTFECEECFECNSIGSSCQNFYSNDLNVITGCEEEYATGTDDVVGVRYKYFHVPAIIWALLIPLLIYFFSRLFIEVFIRLRN